jgi:UDP:flavonoid glycosyltransferase YjiC (YdhE family)
MKVLYISGSLGLGHVTRDLAIARELRRLMPDVEIDWLAVHPASLVIEEAGEKLIPEAAEYANENDFAEESSRGGGLNILRYLLRARKAWDRNVAVFERVVGSRHYDLVIGDETYEISLALRKRRGLKKFPFVMIFDFVGLDTMTRNPLERLGVYIYNYKWASGHMKGRKPSFDLGLFVGEPEDIKDEPFGFMLPSRRRFAEAVYRFVGYIMPFDPADLADRAAVRRALGYGAEPLVIASIGGTSIGSELLELCGKASPLLRERYPSLRMVLVTGPRLAADSVRAPEGVEVRQFVPKLYEHFAACDLSIVQGGATSSLELAALKIPFIYFPLEGHSEQANVARMLRRHGVGVEMKLSRTTPASLAAEMSRMLDSKTSYPGISVDGAKKAAELIARLMNGERS